MSFQDDQVFLEKYLDENLNTVLGLRLAEKYISADNLEGAHLILSEFLEAHPNNATAMFLLGEIAFKEGNNDKAKSHYEDTIQVDPTYVAAYHRLVTICNDDGDEAGVTEIYRLLNLVNPMDKKAAADLEGKEKADASKSDLAERVQNKFQLSSAGDSAVSSDSDELIEETAEDVDSLADELSSKLDADDSANLDKPLDAVEDVTGTEGEDDETEDPFELESESAEEEESEEPKETDSVESADESAMNSIDSESEEEVSTEADSESAEVDAFGVPVGKDESEAVSPQEESPDSTKEEESVAEEVSTEDDSESTEVDAFGTEMTSKETSIDVEEPSEELSEEDSSNSDDSEISSEDMAPEDNTAEADDESSTEEIEPDEETESEEISEEIREEISSEEAPEENEGESDSKTTLDPDEGESSDSADSSEEITLEKEIEDIDSENLAESAQESELGDSVVDKEKREFELPPFSRETLADVKQSGEEPVSEEKSDIEEEVESDDEEIEEDTADDLDEGAVSLNLPLDSGTDAVSTEENDSNEQSEESDSDADDHNIPTDSIDTSDKGELDTPSDFESWVEKDATPESMTTMVSDPNESSKNTFEELLSESDSSGDVETMELPEESDTEITVEDEQDIREEIDDIYSLAQIDDDEVSPLQAWFLERKTPQEEQEQDIEQLEDEENLEAITEPKPVPFSGESGEEAETLQNTEETESEEKWDNFVDSGVEKKGADDSKDRESSSTDIDSELKNIFDEVASPVNENETDEANADAPDITGGVKLNSDLATFTLADIYINQSQFNEALSVLDLLEQKGENLERVASMREEIKIKAEARNK